jgi:hypothetical protein
VTQDEIVEMYLQVSKELCNDTEWCWAGVGEPLQMFAKLVAAKAIAELESQEPMALPCCGYTDASAVKWNPLNGFVQCHNCGQNYTASQRTWVGLTDEETAKCFEAKVISDRLKADAKRIEAKLKEKNGYAEERNT